ncbi:hypothetical protein BJX76DRAFT_351501 [Aspergillus varians]
MLRKKEGYKNLTPIPLCVPRQLALDILHSHSEIITLNPLVLTHQPVKAPQYATPDEYYYTWHEITQRVQVVPGLGKLGSGKISFKGCFHDLPSGLQTHTYAPMGIELWHVYRIVGNQPGETAGAGAGAGVEVGDLDGEQRLYLHEDIQIECNVTLISFVKTQLKAASKVLVERLLKKAELLDAGVLQAMMEDGKLKTYNPADRSQGVQESGPGPGQEAQRLSYQMPTSPNGVSRFGSVSSTNSHSNPNARLQEAVTGRRVEQGPMSPRYEAGGQNMMPVELPAERYYTRPMSGSGKEVELPELDGGQVAKPWGYHPS